MNPELNTTNGALHDAIGARLRGFVYIHGYTSLIAAQNSSNTSVKIGYLQQGRGSSVGRAADS